MSQVACCGTGGHRQFGADHCAEWRGTTLNGAQKRAMRVRNDAERRGNGAVRRRFGGRVRVGCENGADIPAEKATKDRTEMKKKLIEVALPVEAINKETAREKSIRHGHPSTLHLRWARRPLAACRA